VSTSQIDLTWADNSSNEDGFKIERSTDGVNFAQIATASANATTYSNTGLTASTLYYYRVFAYNTAGNSASPSNTASATTLAPPVPNAPSGLTATATSTSQINLTWVDNSSNEDGFKIERSTDGVFFTQIATAAVNATTYSNTGLTASTLYYYRVFAYNASGNSTSPSNTASTTTLGPTALISAGATWKYLDDGSNQNTAWRAVNFNDASWSSGAAQLGYGDGDETTVVSFGPNSKKKFITTYFRRSISVPNPAQFTTLNLGLIRDDGAVVYINGLEVWRSNMPTGTINFKTQAASAIEGAAESTWNSLSVPSSVLVSGTNVIAVEIHQDSATNTDISFDFTLTAQ
jgi:titin